MLHQVCHFHTTCALLNSLCTNTRTDNLAVGPLHFLVAPPVSGAGQLVRAQAFLLLIHLVVYTTRFGHALEITTLTLTLTSQTIAAWTHQTRKSEVNPTDL